MAPAAKRQKVEDGAGPSAAKVKAAPKGKAKAKAKAKAKGAAKAAPKGKAKAKAKAKAKGRPKKKVESEDLLFTGLVVFLHSDLHHATFFFPCALAVHAPVSRGESKSMLKESLPDLVRFKVQTLFPSQACF